MMAFAPKSLLGAGSFTTIESLSWIRFPSIVTLATALGRPSPKSRIPTAFRVMSLPRMTESLE
jgi:hypothetical protein